MRGRQGGQAVRAKRKTPRPKTLGQRVVSAGGVVFRGAAPEVLVISLKGGRVVTLPKGQVEAGERYPETALREVLEETGIRGVILNPLGKVQYYFTVWQEGMPATVRKEVHYFLMRAQDENATPRPQLSEVEAAFFLPAREALERLSYPNEREILRKALLRWATKRLP